MPKEMTFSSPGIFEREIDQTQQQQQPLGTPAGVVGTSERGPAFVPITVGSMEDFKTRFGDLNPKMFGPYAVKEFLAHRSAVTFTRVLGAGANSTSGDIEKTRLTDQVKNAGFVVTGSARAAEPTALGGHVGAVQFIAAQHSVSTNEGYGLPMFTDNDSVSARLPKLVRGMLFTASGSRFIVADGDSDLRSDFASVDSWDDVATLNASNEFKLILSSTLGSDFYSTDGLPGIKVFTASLDPDKSTYIGKLLNTDPESFPTEQHMLYCDYAVDAQIASASSNAGAVAILSGSAYASSVSGDASMAFRDVFGHFDSRYKAPRTPSVISQPFGKTEYDLFHVETIDDGADANTRFKISIRNIKKASDPSDRHGTFTLVVRDFNDTDTNQSVLEQFPDLSLDPTSDRFVGQVIGDRSVYFNFDAENDGERRLVVDGRYPNKSRFIRVKLTDALLEGNVPAEALPFGFRGYPLLKTTDTLDDVGPLVAERLTGITSGSLTGLTGSVLPPVPYRFKVTKGDVATTGFAGNPGTNEIVNANYYWGVKFERSTNALNPNASSEANACIAAYTKLMGLAGLDALVTGSAVDTFNANKFTLARVAFSNAAITDLTASAGDHMKEAAYIRNATPDATDYHVDDGVLTNRMTLATLAALTSSTEFNKFASFNKFSMFMYGGFDGVNILDKNAARLDDKASSFDADGGAESSFTSPGLNCNTNGTDTSNNQVNSYQTAIRIMTDPLNVTHNILAIPGIRESYVTDYAARKTHDYELALYLMDPASYDEDGNRLYDDSTAKPDVGKTTAEFESRAIDNNYVSTYFPDVQIDDEVNNRRVYVPSSIAAMAALAFNDRVAYPWFAPAGFNRASLDFVKNVRVRLNAGDRNTLATARMNPIAPFPRHGFVIYGQRTLQYAHTALDRVNVRRLLIEVKRIIKGIAANLVFEQNDPSTRKRFVKDAIVQIGLIQSQAGIESFKVIMDASNNTDKDVEQNKINGSIVLVPTRTAEDISIDFIITPSGISFV